MTGCNDVMTGFNHCINSCRALRCRSDKRSLRLLVGLLVYWCATAPLPAEDRVVTASTGGVSAATEVLTNTDQDSREQARRLFRKLEHSVAEQPWLLAEHRLALSNYPLTPYLEAAVLSARLAKADEAELSAFLLRHEGAVFAESLRADWLRYLARRSDATGFLLYYRPTSDLDLRCHYLDYRLASRSTDPVLQEFTTIWLRAEPLPAACTTVEKRWIAAKERSPERIWQRLELAVSDNETATIRAIRALLPASEQALVDNWLKLRQKPQRVTEAQLFTAPTAEIWRVKTWALERLAWGDRDEALAIWEKVAVDPAYPAAWRDRAMRSYGLALAGAGHPAASRFLAAIPSTLTDERVAAARIVDAMRRLDWATTDYWLGQLKDEDRQSSRWQYFAGRSQAAQQQDTSALDHWQAIAGKLDYYGFLARGQLNQQHRLQAPPLSVAPELVVKIRQLPEMQRAQEWLALERQVPARREWQAMSQRLSPAELQAAAVVANDWNWPDRAIAALGRAPAPGAWELRFPLTHSDTLKREALQHELPATWAFAITRQESMFITDAKSSAGALGLMQLMPATAKQTAHKHRIRYTGSHDLIQPNQNIRLGVAHLADLIDHNDGNFVYATAAYNAGQARVNRWRNQFGELPLDIWIETIPFRETQTYVKNVMAFSLIYAERLGQDPQVFRLLTSSAKAPLPAAKPAPGPSSP